MRRLKLPALARSITLLVSVGAPCLAHAADLLPPLPPEPLPPPVEIGGGWYLRGDVGVGAVDIGKAKTKLLRGNLPDGYAYDQLGAGDQFFAGGGVGYGFGFFRGDVTAEYRGGTKLYAVDRFNGFFPDGTRGIGVNKYDGKLSSVLVMANGYIDLGTWHGVTPFVGGGVGYAYHTISNFSDVGAGTALGGFGTAPDKHSGSFAWAAHAGLAYSVTPNVQLELAYRYLNMGQAKTGNVACINDPGCSLASYSFKNITSQDVKIGMRWLLGGVGVAALPPLAPSYEPAPLVRKY